MDEHRHDYEIHYAAVDWQDPAFIKCQGCGSTFSLVKKVFLVTTERMADAVEDILHTEYTLEEWEELRNAWQAYVEIAPSEEDSSDV